MLINSLFISHVNENIIFGVPNIDVEVLESLSLVGGTYTSCRKYNMIIIIIIMYIIPEEGGGEGEGGGGGGGGGGRSKKQQMIICTPKRDGR